MRVAWWVLFPISALVTGRLILEQTYLSWKLGPQMVGFAIVHDALYLLPAIGAIVLAHLWVLVAVVWLSRRLPSGGRVAKSEWIRMVLLGSTLLLFHVPHAVWRGAVVSLAGPGREAGAQLVDAAAEGQLGVVETLLAAGVDVNTPDSDGDTAVKGAAAGGSLAMIQFLVGHGGDVNAAGGPLNYTPLMSAAEMGHEEIVAFLLRAGADPAARDKNGRTALEIATAEGHRELARILAAGARQGPMP